MQDLFVENVRKGETSKLASQVKKGADPKAISANGQHAVVVALRSKQLGCLRELIRLGGLVDLSEDGPDRDSPLKIAVQLMNMEAVEILLAGGADAAGKWDRDKEGFPSPVWYCVYQNKGNSHIAMLKLLLLKGKPNLSNLEFPQGKDGGGSAVWFASYKNQVQALELLISVGADVDSPNITTNSCSTPLEIASQEGHLEIVKLLLGAGAQPSHHALTLAIHRVRVEVIVELICAGANINEKAVDNGNAPLAVAAMHPSPLGPTIVGLLISAGAEVDRGNNHMETAVHLAAERGNADSVKELVEGLANLELIDGYHRTPLAYACQHGHVETVKVLLKGCPAFGKKCPGADPNHSPRPGFSPLQLAYHFGKVDVVRVLVGAGVRWEEGSPMPRTEFNASVHNELATLLVGDLMQRRQELIRALKQNPPELTVVSRLVGLGKLNPNFAISLESGERATPLMLACKISSKSDNTYFQELWVPYVQTVKLMILEGAAVNVELDNGTTALYYAACMSECHQLVELLLGYSGKQTDTDLLEESAVRTISNPKVRQILALHEEKRRVLQVGATCLLSGLQAAQYNGKKVLVQQTAGGRPEGRVLVVLLDDLLPTPTPAPAAADAAGSDAIAEAPKSLKFKPQNLVRVCSGRGCECTELRLRCRRCGSSYYCSRRCRDDPSRAHDAACAFINEEKQKSAKSFREALFKNDVHAIREAIESGADLGSNVVGYDKTPLEMAASLGHVDCLRELLKAGVDANSGDAVAHAIRARKIDTMRVLIQEHNADVRRIQWSLDANDLHDSRVVEMYEMLESTKRRQAQQHMFQGFRIGGVGPSDVSPFDLASLGGTTPLEALGQIQEGEEEEEGEMAAYRRQLMEDQHRFAVDDDYDDTWEEEEEEVKGRV